MPDRRMMAKPTISATTAAAARAPAGDGQQERILVLAQEGRQARSACSCLQAGLHVAQPAA